MAQKSGSEKKQVYFFFLTSICQVWNLRLNIAWHLSY